MKQKHKIHTDKHSVVLRRYT